MLKLTLILLFGYCGLVLFVYLFQERMIFFPQKMIPPDLEPYAAREVTFAHEDVTLHGWLVRGGQTEDGPLIVYYGGNAEEVSVNLADARRFSAGRILLVNYRGYGKSTGRPTQDALFRDALFILDEVTGRLKIPPARVILMGRSLGTGVAVHAAAQRNVGGLILVTPFDSLTNVARKHYPVFPVGLLLRHRFESLALAPGIRVPTLGLMAGRDAVIPLARSKQLLEKFAGPVQSVVVPEATHNDIQLYDRYWRAINEYLDPPAS